jgi:RNA polymerase sigma-70 factor (ECF subfamily)
MFLARTFSSLQHGFARRPARRTTDGVNDRGGSSRRRPGGEPDDDFSHCAPMTAGPATRVAPQPTVTPHLVAAGAGAPPTTAAFLPAAGFTARTAIDCLLPEAASLPGLELPEATGTAEPAGTSDSRVLIDSLVAGAVNGSARARDELLALIHPLVLKYCRARLGRQESLMGSADDVAQDVCMAVVSALPNYQLKGLSFRAFVYGIAAHKVTDAFRAIGRNRTEPVAEIPDGPVTVDGPEPRVLAAEMSARLAALLGHLTPRQREVLVLRLAVGLSAEETAQAVRSTPGAVRVTQHRALGRLRRLLMGESAARVLDDPTTGDPVPGESEDVPADDSALDAMAAFLDGRVPAQVVRRPVPRRR